MRFTRSSLPCAIVPALGVGGYVRTLRISRAHTALRIRSRTPMRFP